MEVEKENMFASCCPPQNGSRSSTPNLLPQETHEDGLSRHAPWQSTLIPNRIFVGGLYYKVSESDLRHVFSQHGAVTEVKIVIDRAGLSKGYGFVTFETQDDAQRILLNANGIFFKDKKLSIGQAFRKQHASGRRKIFPVASPDPAFPPPMSCGDPYPTTSAGCPYGHHDEVACFHCPGVNPAALHCPWPAPLLMLPQSQQPVYQQQPFHYYQYVPSQCQWNVVQVASGPVLYPPPAGYQSQPSDGGSFQQPLPVREDATPEFLDPPVQPVYALYQQSAGEMTPAVVQHDPGKNQRRPHAFPHPKQKYRRHIDPTHHQPPPESTEPPGANVLHGPGPLM